MTDVRGSGLGFRSPRLTMLALLPCENLTEDATQEQVSEGITASRKAMIMHLGILDPDHIVTARLRSSGIKMLPVEDLLVNMGAWMRVYLRRCSL
jgi:hypothetical protein